MLLFYQISAWVFLIHMFLYAGFYFRETISQTSLVRVYCWRAIDRVAFREIESHEIDFFEAQDRHSYFVCTLPRSKKLSGE